MPESAAHFSMLILIAGATIVLALLVKSALQRTGVPSLVGYLVLGFLFRLADSRWHFLSEHSHKVLCFLAKIGLVSPLFRIGLESNIRGLLRQLRPASPVWIGDVSISGLVGYATASFLLGLSWITSLVVAVACTATSVGISVGVWRGDDALKLPNGAFLLELVLFSAVCFSFSRFLADGIPVFAVRGTKSALPIGAGMVPPAVLGAMVVASGTTRIISPVAVRKMLQRWPQQRSEPAAAGEGTSRREREQRS